MYLSAPKLLLVFYQKRESFLQIKFPLDDAKFLRLVDFVVVQVTQDKPPIVYRNDLVSGKVETLPLSNISLDSKLFPDYIKNMNGYNLRVG